MTTVGYGDLAPQTTLGRLLSIFVMLVGYGIIAVPTGIVTVEMVRARDQAAVTPCPNCQRTGHDEDAHFCKYCGSSLGESDRQGEGG